MIRHAIAGLILGFLLIYGGPLATGFLAKMFGPDYAIWGLAVPAIIFLILAR